MRRAGFARVETLPGELVHRYDAEGYLRFLTQFDEQSLFEDLEPDERLEIEDEMRERLTRLSPEELTLRLPVVYAIGEAR
jgi:hypothetical protein